MLLTVLKWTSLSAVAGLALWGAVAIYDHIGTLSGHYGEPIIIDNGPSEIKVLPRGHRDHLVPGSSSENESASNDKWVVTDKKPYAYLKILPKGADCETKNGLCTALSKTEVQVEFVDKDGGTPRILVVDHSNFTGTQTGYVSLLPKREATEKPSWARDDGFLGLGQTKLNGSKDYRVKSVIYYPNPPQQDGSPKPWQHADQSKPTDVKVYFCTNPQPRWCEDSPNVR